MKCLVFQKEITEVECQATTLESYKEKNGKQLSKKFKRIIGWKAICKQCKHHQKPKI